MAGIEIGIMCRQALAKQLPTFEKFKRQVAARTKYRNSEHNKINRQFITDDARLKLKKLYPKL